MSNEQKEKKQILAQVDDMIQYLEKSIRENQKGIQAAEQRIELAHAEIRRSTDEITQRINDGKELATKLATWKAQKSTLESL